jgi:hypothetical protein
MTEGGAIKGGAIKGGATELSNSLKMPETSK